MGLFDLINVEHDCYNCGSTLSNYQTKALDSCLVEYKLGDTIDLFDLEIIIGSFDIHDYCNNCNYQIEGSAYIKDKIIWRVTEKRNEKEVVIAEYTPS
jgi:hypothetical protein